MRFVHRTETAKLMRAALKQAFPATKFSVRSDSYAGGGAIRVSWTDGPTVRRVDAILSQYDGKGFDGMIDMDYSIEAWVLGDKVLGTRSTGTEGSRGSVPAWGLIPPHDDAELVQFNSGYVSTTRHLSTRFLRRLVQAVASYWGLSTPEVSDCMFVDETPEQKQEAYAKTGYYWGSLVSQAANDRTSVVRGH